MSNESKHPNIEQLSRLQRKVSQLEGLVSRYKNIKSVQTAMLQLSELASTTTNMAEFYPAVHSIFGQLLRAENFYVVLVDKATGLFTSVYFCDQTDNITLNDLQSSMFEEGLTGYVYRSGSSLLADPPTVSRLTEQGEVVKHGADSSCWMGTPLKRDQRPIGVVAVQTYDETVYTAADQDLLEFISLHLVTAIDRIKQRDLLEQEVLNRTRELSKTNQNLQLEIKERHRAEVLQSALFKISQITATAVLMDDFYRAIHNVLQTLMYAENCCIALLSENGRRQRIDFPFYVDSINQQGLSRQFGSGLIEYVINKGEACLISDSDKAVLEHNGVQYRRQNSRKRFAQEATSWLGAPLIINDRVMGVIATQTYSHEHQYLERDLDVLRFVSHHLAVAIERKRANDELRMSHDELENQVLTRTQELRQSNLFLKLQIEEREKAEEKLTFEATHDALTGLPNRKLLLHSMAIAITKQKQKDTLLVESTDQRRLSVLFIDLDRFKLINDTLGHQAGDAFLIEVSLRISACIRDNDVLARLGGDEFVILLDDVNSLDDVEDVSERIVKTMSAPFYINAQEVYSGASVGIACYKPEYQNADDMLRDADAAMYQAKSMGRGRFIVFDDTMHQRLMEDLSIEQTLHRAVKERLLSPRYESMYELLTGKEVGCEARVSWCLPSLGDVDEDTFLALAQSNAVILEIEQQILDEVCRQMIKGGTLSHIRLVCVRISGLHLSQSKGLQQLLAIVEQAQIDPHKLCLEFRENSLLTLDDVAIGAFKRIKQLGISICVQGFGSGVSSLGLLTQNQVDYVKVDSRFCQTLEKNNRNRILLQSLIGLSQAFKFRVIVDGVHTKALHEIADEYQVTIAMGRFFEVQAAEKAAKLRTEKLKLVLHKFG